MNPNELPRRNPYLNQAIELLDQYYIRANSNVKEAWGMLSAKEESFIENELEWCITDARYYLENYHVIQPIEGKMQTLMFLDSQEIIYEIIYQIQQEGRPVKLVVLKARQIGSSTLAEGLIFHKTIFTRGCNTLIVAQDPGQAAFLFEMSRMAYDRLPWWMKPSVRYDVKGASMVFDKKDEAERELRPGMRSQIIVEAANKMTSAGRGKTFLACHMSELASWRDGGLLSKSLFPTLHGDDELAVMESTAEGRTGFWYEWWKGVENGETDWTPVFVPYYRIKKYSLPILKDLEFKLTDEEKYVRNKVEEDDNFTIPDATFNWVRRKKREFVRLEGDEFGFYQEYPSNPHEAFQASGLCAFPKRILQKILERCPKPLWYGEIYYKSASHRDVYNFFDPVEQKMGQLHRVERGEKIPVAKEEGERLRVWEEPAPGCEYYIAGDVAMGDGGDFSCAEVLKIGRGQSPDEQVAEWRGWINPTDFALILAALGYWYNEAEVAVEVNSVGAVTNNHIFRVLEYPQLYRWKYIDKVTNFITPYFGWYTNSKTRPLIVVKAREAIMQNTVVIRSDDLIDEMMAFSRDEDEGRYEGRGTPDDRVLAFCIARYCAHEFDYGDESNAKSKPASAAGETFYIFDNMNRLRFQSPDRELAERYVRDPQRAGWSMRSMPVRRDFNNTDFSPIHDKAGIMQDLHYKYGVPEHRITAEMATKAKEELSMYASIGMGGNPEEDDWRK